MKKLKVVYCTPSIYIAGGVERVLTTKANYLANQEDKYDVTIILTDGKEHKPFYKLSEKVKVINLNIGFEELWDLSFLKKIPVYLKKQHLFKKRLTEILVSLKPDITISTLRREINFINDIPDGSKKIGEMHINRHNYRNFEEGSTNLVKRMFSKWWMKRLVKKLKRLDKFVVLTDEDLQSWPELRNACVIPNPLPGISTERSSLTEKQVIAVGRYSHEKGIDLLLQAWSIVEAKVPDWHLVVYGAGDKTPYQKLADELHLDKSRYALNGPTIKVQEKYLGSSIFALSSRFEGFGMVILEAMSYGLPVVSFNCNYGPQALIDNGVDGLLVENGNPEKLAEGIIRLINDKELRTHLANAAREKSRHYSIQEIGKQWEGLFSDLTSCNSCLVGETQVGSGDGSLIPFGQQIGSENRPLIQ